MANTTRRKIFRSALASKKLADQILSEYTTLQTKFNATMDKLAADNAATLDVNYVSTQALAAFSYDSVIAPGQHKATYRKALRAALANKKLADTIILGLSGMKTNFNALLVKLDAEAGTLNDVNYASTLSTAPVSPDAHMSGCQNKATYRQAFRSALARKPLADELLDGMVTLQTAMNAILVHLDAKALAAVAAHKVTVLNADV